ncbi:MAG: signal peptidase II [Pseudomonadota bacterium]
MTGLSRALSTALAILALDQATKWWIVEAMELKTRGVIEVFPPFLTLVMAWNRGINFGLFASDSETSRWILFGIAVTVSIGLAIWSRRQAGWLIPVAIGLVMGGAIGNAIDRVRYGAVADFLNMSCCGIANPYAFNVADIAIFAGAALLIIFSGGDAPPTGANAKRKGS